MGFVMDIIDTVTDYVNEYDINPITGWTSDFLGLGTQEEEKKKDEGGRRSSVLRDRLVSVRQPVAPRVLIYGKTRVGGVITFLHVTGSSNEILHCVVTLTGRKVNDITAFYLDGEEVPLSGNEATGRYAGYVKVYYNFGDVNQTAIAALVSAVPSKWTSNHRQRGCAHAYVQLTYDRDLFPSGIPNMTFDVEGAPDIYDPRTETTGYTTNAALCVADFISSDIFGFGAAYDDEIIEADLIEAANVCDEAVSLAAGGTEDRYACNGVLYSDQEPKSNLESLLTAMAGNVVTTGVYWYVRAGAYRMPSVTITDDDIVGAVNVRTRRPKTSLFNSGQGTFISADHDYQPTDFPPQSVSAWVTDDSGEEIWEDLEYPFTTSRTTAERLTRLAIEKNRRQITGSIVCRMRAYKIMARDTFYLTVSRFGWSSKVFVATSVTLIQKDGGETTVRIDFAETDSAVYTWSTSYEGDPTPASTTDLPSSLDIDAPTSLVIDESLYVTRDAMNVKALVKVSWTLATSAYVDYYAIQYKLATDSDWTSAGLIDASQDYAEIFDFGIGTFDFRVKAVSVLGVSSDWLTGQEVITGLYATPDDLTGLTISTISSLAFLQWDRSADLDVIVGGKIAFRHSPALSGATWEEATSIGQSIDGGSTVTFLPLKSGTYLLKAVDSGGRYSTNPATVTTDAPNLLTFANIDTIEEHPTFAGTHSNTIFDGTYLKLDGQGAFDDIPILDDVPDLDAYGGYYTIGTYTFAAGYDRGSVGQFRLVETIVATSAPDETDAGVWFRITDDDPTGTPTWSAWQRMNVSDVSGRAAQFQCRLTTDDTSNTIKITELSVSIDEVA